MIVFSSVSTVICTTYYLNRQIFIKSIFYLQYLRGVKNEYLLFAEDSLQRTTRPLREIYTFSVSNVEVEGYISVWFYIIAIWGSEFADSSKNSTPRIVVEYFSIHSAQCAIHSAAQENSRKQNFIFHISITNPYKWEMKTWLWIGMRRLL